MLDDLSMKPAATSRYRVVLLTLDAHAAGPAAAAEARLAAAAPGLAIEVHAAAPWAENPAALEAAKAAVAEADLVIVTLLFLDEHIQAILPALKARREACDAMVGCVSAQEIVSLTKLGGLDMSQPASGLMALMKRLRGAGKKDGKPTAASGEKQLKMLRRLPRILKFIPGKAQDLRAYFLTMQYWLGGSDANVEQMIRFLVSRYAGDEALRELEVAPPLEYPETGLYHPATPERIFTEPELLPAPPGEPVGAVGLLLMRSYVLAGDAAHYDAVIAALEAKGLRVIPAFAAGLDGRPAIDRYFTRPEDPKEPEGPRVATIDALVSLTGFSLVGGPAYHDSDAAAEALGALDVPYFAAHALEFQTLPQWEASDRGLGPVETTMLVALPEIDGATNPTVFGGRGGDLASARAPGALRAGPAAGAPINNPMAPHPERVERLAARIEKAVRLRRTPAAERRLAIVLYGFPPKAGAVGTAAYLSVFESLYNTLHALKADGYAVEPPESVAALKRAVLSSEAENRGQEAAIAARIPAEELVAREPHLAEIEAAWGPAPGRAQSDGSGVFILGAFFGEVFVGVQPGFGYEGDPMRLLFEKGFAPTHAFSAFYRWLREDLKADAVLHFGMHGALEFMPGKHAGMSGACWPDRLIGDVPHVYLYAANNPSEATLAKRRANAITISHLTPPLAKAGLYKGLAELKDTLSRWRVAPPEAAEERAELAALAAEQAEACDMAERDPERLWLALLETEDALIPDGLHVMGEAMSEPAIAEHLSAMAAAGASEEACETARAALGRETEMAGLLRALDGRFTPPAPGGDLIRSPEILPTGRNIHAFNPFGMPTAYALRDGARQAESLIAKHRESHGADPRSVALVLWGSDNIKTDGGPLAQALALMGARPRFDAYGRLSGAELIGLETLGRPRIDVVMTLSGIFRDLLPLQTKLLAEAAYLAAAAEEPVERNFVRAHALAEMAARGVDLETAALRVFSNAEGAYGSNVNQLIDSGAWGAEEELADAYETRKGFAYGRSGACSAQPAALQGALKTVDLAYQNLESVELGVTTVDHYFDTLGGVSRSVKRARGEEIPVYIADQTRGGDTVRSLRDQIALETRSRALNPKWFEGLLKHGGEGVRQIEAQITNTLGWSATTGQVDPWVYDRLTEAFVLDDAMRQRLAELNPVASLRVANRLIEAHERAYWSPDEATLEALRAGADELEDRLEGLVPEDGARVAAE
ncbi:MAG: magnesium chelatase subunit H [Pseudomonadota bacterium]